MTFIIQQIKWFKIMTLDIIFLAIFSLPLTNKELKILIIPFKFYN